MTLTCPECDRLWQELALAAKAYVRIYGQQKGVAAQRVSTAFSRAELKDAAKTRWTARRAVKAHDSTHTVAQPAYRNPDGARISPHTTS